jgi:hypothetical protein
MNSTNETVKTVVVVVGTVLALNIAMKVTARYVTRLNTHLSRKSATN